MHGKDANGKNVNQIDVTKYDYDLKERVHIATVDTGTLAGSMTRGNLAALLSDYANKMGPGFKSGKDAGLLLRADHRTLQRSIVCLALGLIAGISDQDYTDPRNATAIATAKKIATMMKDGELPLGQFT